MRRNDLLDLAIRNVRNSKLRNALTTLGIAVGVASLVAMLSLGIGLQQFADSRLKGSGLFDSIFVTAKGERGPDREEENVPPQKDEQPPPPLDDSARAAMQKLPNVLSVEPEIRAMAQVEYNDKPHASFIAGLPDSARASEGFDKMDGRFFSSTTADEAILQKDFAKRLEADPKNLIGKKITLRYAERGASEIAKATPTPAAPDSSSKFAGDAAMSGFPAFSVTRKEKTLTVVGLIDSEPFGGMRMISRARVFLPNTTAENMNLMQFSDTSQVVRGNVSGRTYTMLTVRASSASEAEAIEASIKKMGFQAWSMLDAASGLSRFFRVLDAFLGIFGSLALAVASLAIINTLVMAVLERRREIGIMKAIGASDRDVRRLFFAEAAAMGATGGALGVFLGWLMGRIINFFTNMYLARHKIPAENLWSVPWWLVLGAIGFAVLVSIAAGIYPAARASKLDPVQALRYE
ncbi:MAG TPA: ABC transporter permease [Candidatus Binataceae bacterium]|nr:ABC transporter permease [Candidatus Binataceae bacterium]